MLHPDVQARAKVEIDAVVGRERLPEFGDRAHPGDRAYGLFGQHDRNESIDDDGRSDSKLVYVEAVCRELLRWIVILPLGLPHAAFKDDVYEEMFIPKGTVIFFHLHHRFLFIHIIWICFLRSDHRRQCMVSYPEL